MILLLYFFPTEAKYFRGFLRCKQKFHIVLQGPSWSSLFLPLLTQLNQFPPFGVLNVRFSSATEPLLRFFSLPERLSHLWASHPTSSLPSLHDSSAPFSMQLDCNFHWVIFAIFYVIIPGSISWWPLSRCHLFRHFLHILVWFLIRKFILFVSTPHDSKLPKSPGPSLFSSITVSSNSITGPGT